MRLIDVDRLWDSVKTDVAPFNISMLSRHIHKAPTIDPENLPIVRELREQLAKAITERDRAIEDMNIGKFCGNCAYCGDDDFELPFVNCLCSFECRNLSRWEWRGI